MTTTIIREEHDPGVGVGAGGLWAGLLEGSVERPGRQWVRGTGGVAGALPAMPVPWGPQHVGTDVFREQDLRTALLQRPSFFPVCHVAATPGTALFGQWAPPAGASMVAGAVGQLGLIPCPRALRLLCLAAGRAGRARLLLVAPGQGEKGGNCDTWHHRPTLP